jgi:hypothetical protein
MLKLDGKSVLVGQLLTPCLDCTFRKMEGASTCCLCLGINNPSPPMPLDPRIWEGYYT